MSEQQRGYEKYLPGDVVRMEIQIRHHPMHLHKAGAVFRQQGREDADLWAEGEEFRTVSTRAALAGRDLGHQSAVQLSVRIGRVKTARRDSY